MSSRWQVSSTQEVSYSPAGRYDYGFSVLNFQGAPLLAVAFDTVVAAVGAEAAMRKIIDGAAPRRGREGRGFNAPPALWRCAGRNRPGRLAASWPLGWAGRMG
jgi:hypothetical protein